MKIKKIFLVIPFFVVSLILSTDLVLAQEFIFYPDPDPEITSVDGEVGRFPPIIHEEDFTTIRNSVGTLSDDDSAIDPLAKLKAGENINLWERLIRGIILFDTSSLPDDCEISSAIFSVYPATSCDLLDTTPFALGLVSSNPISNIGLEDEDYNTLGTTRFATDIPFDDILINEYNDLVLNSSGISAISKTGITKFGTRFSTDIDNIDPTIAWIQGGEIIIYTNYAEGDYKPKLIVNCEIPEQPTIVFPVEVDFVASVLTFTDQLFIDLLPYIVMIMGIPIAFLVIRKIIATFKK